MMFSPDEYYECFLKGKSAEQIMSRIRSLKREINRLIRALEDPEYVPLGRPSEYVQLLCSRKYLEEAKRALAEAGGTYVFTKAEEKEIAFRESIPYVSRITFSIGYALGDHKVYTLSVDEHIRLRVTHLFDPEANTPETIFNLKKEELFETLCQMHISQWRRRYDNCNVLDGTQWVLTIAFSNGSRTVHIYGSNAYPYNFQELLELFGITEDYNAEYPDDEQA